MNVTWTAEAEKTLRELWPDPKMSCAMIADEMGVTRNMVIGKARRLGLGSKVSSHPKTNTAKRSGPVISKKRVKIVRKILTGETFVPRGAADIVPFHLTILQVTDKTCKYGYGDGPFTFCGHPVLEGQSYCPAHCALVYVAPRERSEAQRANDLRMSQRARNNRTERTQWMAEEAA